MYMVGFATLVVAANALASGLSTRFVEVLVAACLVAAAVSSVIALAQGLRLDWVSFVEQLRPDGRAFANLTQPNHLASLLGLGLASVWWLFEKRWIHCAAVAALTIFLGAALAMTQSRIALLFLAGALFLWVVKGRRLGLRTHSIGLVGFILLVASLFAVWPGISSAIEGSAVYGVAERLQVGGGRKVHWPAMWDAIWRQPVWGWGWLQGTAAQQAVALDHPASGEWITYSHSLVLDLLLWNGVPIGATAISFLILWTVSRIRRCSDLDGFIALVACSVIAVHALVEFPYAYAYFLFPLAMWMGVVEARHASAGPTLELRLPKAAVASASLVLIGMLGWLWMEYQQIEEMSQRTRFAEARYVVPAGMQPAVPDVVLIDSQREFLRFRQMSARPQMSPEELEVVRRVSQRFMPPAVLLRRALAMGLNGNEADALYSLRLICKVWTEKNCQEGRESWASAQALYPQISHIGFPEDGP
jgi:O-antigen ligase